MVYTDCNNGDIRLSTPSTEGQVEICSNGIWTPVCHDYWDANEATVVCRQLEYNTINVIGLINYGNHGGPDPVHQSNVNCTGLESRLSECPACEDCARNATTCKYASSVRVNCFAQGNICKV